MNLKGKLKFVSQTDVGRIRDHNEDYISTNDRLGIAILADGMGGLNAGEVASSMSAHLLMDELVSWREGASVIEAELEDDDGGLTTESRVVRLALARANNAVFHVSQTQPQCRGMGTTIVVSLFYDNKVSVAHIGDSRMYRYREDVLEPITRDHSFVQELLDKGLYTEQEARASSKKNVVTRALGVAPNVEVEVGEFDVHPGDVYLMCSDGLTDLVHDKDIETTLRELGSDLDEAAAHLVDVANASGGKDNISVVLIRAVKPFPRDGGFIEKIVNWFE